MTSSRWEGLMRQAADFPVIGDWYVHIESLLKAAENSSFVPANGGELPNYLERLHVDLAGIPQLIEQVFEYGVIVGMRDAIDVFQSPVLRTK